jgi:hypothetical protein
MNASINVVTSAVVSVIISIISNLVIWRIKSSQEKKEQKKRLASALAAEIEVLMKQYEKIGGPLLQQSSENKLIFFVTDIDDDFFTIYNHNADKLGYFDAELVQQIVSLYTDAKGFVCSIKTWNHLVQELKKLQQRSQQINEILRYHDALKEQHDRVFTAAKKTVCALKSI